MAIPVDNEFMHKYILKLKIEENKREVAHRLQQDYAVFISYSHSDREVVGQIIELFNQRKIRYVIDEKALEWGNRISVEVQQYLEGCTHYLPILSDRSAKSQWCAYEHGIASGQKKKVLIYLTGKDVAVPSFAAPVLATADIKEVEVYFSRHLIDAAAVDRFIAEILADSKARLETFQSLGEDKERREAWDAPDRQAIEETRSNPLARYIDDYVETNDFTTGRICKSF